MTQNILELTECYVNKNKTILGDPGQQIHDSDSTECYVHVKHNILEDPGQQMYDSALTECYVHLKHNYILEDPGKHKCMITLD